MGFKNESFVNGVKKLAVISAGLVLTGCGIVEQGNFAIEQHFGGEYNQQPIHPGFHPLDNVLDKFYEVYDREYILSIADTKPKDKNKILLKDLDLNISYKVNKEAAPEFISKRAFDLTYSQEKGAYILGINVLDKEVRSLLNVVTQKFASEEILMDQNKFESEFKKYLQEHMDKLYPNKLFNITDVRVSSVLVADTVEDKIQAIALVQSEKEKNDAIQNVLKNREETLIKEMSVYKKASEASGVPLSAIIELKRIEAMRELTNGKVTPTISVDAPPPPKP